MSKVKNWMMDMEDLVDAAVFDGNAKTWEEVASYAKENSMEVVSTPVSLVDLDHCKRYYEQTLGEM